MLFLAEKYEKFKQAGNSFKRIVCYLSLMCSSIEIQAKIWNLKFRKERKQAWEHSSGVYEILIGITKQGNLADFLCADDSTRIVGITKQ